ncbi:MAG: ComEC/Rec2 family competence protein [Chlamydiales bacterium]
MKLCFSHYPALLVGLFLLFGTLFALQTPWVLLPVFAVFFLVQKNEAPPLVVIFLLPLPFFYHSYHFPISQIEIEGVLHIQSKTPVEGFAKGWLYQGILSSQEGRTPCRIRSKEPYPANCHYKIQGTLSKGSGPFYKLKTDQPWIAIEKCLSPVEWRLKSRGAIKKYISQRYASQTAATFLTTLVSGEGNDRLMRKAFNQLGLSHLIAVSGLHFALLICLFHLLFRLFLPPKIEAIGLILLATLYFLLVGNASAERAWLIVMIFLIGELIEKRTSSLNALGVALIGSLLLHPMSALSLGFQLSFLATAGILFLYRPIEQGLRVWIPKLKIQQIMQHSILWQQGYIVLSFFRKTLALNLAVHLALLPLFLLYFHSFSLNSLVYNLFFPYLLSLSLILFIIALALGDWLHALNNSYTQWLLKITESPPLLFKTFYLETIPHWVVAAYLTALFLIAVRWQIEDPAYQES